MGGHALTTVRTVRKTLPEYTVIKEEVFAKLSALDVEFAPVFEVPDKADFGDLDVLIRSSDVAYVTTLVKLHFGAHEIVTSGPVISFDYISRGGNHEPFQVDFILTENLHMAQFYFSYGDTGAILGRIASSVGIKYGQNGLYIYLLHNTIEPSAPIDQTNPYGRIQLTDDPELICEFFGYDYETWERGFATKEAIMNWIMGSKYFTPTMFETGNAMHRKRIVKRPFYVEFMEKLNVNLSQTANDKTGEMQNNEQPRAIEFFGAQPAVDALMSKIKHEDEIRTRYSGKMFVELGVAKKMLTPCINAFKASRGDFAEYLEHHTRDEVFEDVKRFVSSYKQ